MQPLESMEYILLQEDHQDTVGPPYPRRADCSTPFHTETGASSDFLYLLEVLEPISHRYQGMTMYLHEMKITNRTVFLTGFHLC